MNVNEYQELAMTTFRDKFWAFCYGSLALAPRFCYSEIKMARFALSRTGTKWRKPGVVVWWWIGSNSRSATTNR